MAYTITSYFDREIPGQLDTATFDTMDDLMVDGIARQFERRRSYPGAANTALNFSEDYFCDGDPIEIRQEITDLRMEIWEMSGRQELGSWPREKLDAYIRKLLPKARASIAAME